MTWQIREYTVKPGKMDEWIDEWKSQIVPLRRRHGFEILGALRLEGTDQFVWIISYDGPKPWQDANADYYQSPERKAIDPDSARHLAHTETRLMSSVLEVS